MPAKHGLSERGRQVFSRHPEMDPNLWGSAPMEVMEETLDFIEAEYSSIEYYLSKIGFGSSWQQKLITALSE